MNSFGNVLLPLVNGDVSSGSLFGICMTLLVPAPLKEGFCCLQQ